MPARLSPHNLAALFWVLLMGAALYARPHLPVDETRYLAVAWEMWLRGDFLVPHLNGETYSHKPPLLFWLMQAGWQVFGVNEWWPRLVAPLFGLGCLFLVRRLAIELWPDDPCTHDLAPMFLVGCAFWSLFVTLTMFDMMLAFFGLLGLLGVLIAYRKPGLLGLCYLAVAVGLGLLTKGPAILLHILPVALTAPLWFPRMSGATQPATDKPGFWYLKLLIAVGVGIGLALAWAIPAGIAGGDAYQQEIFWGQAAGRMVQSFAHQRPLWWYTALLPVLVLPWFIWPPLWKAIRAYGAEFWRDGASLMCLIWFATAFIAFSLISGKQLHYLLPEFPALALLLARSLSKSGFKAEGRRHLLLPVGVFGVLGAVLILLQFGMLPGRLPVWSSEVDGLWGFGLIAVALAAFVYAPAKITNNVIVLSALPLTLVVVLHLALAPVLQARYNMAPLAKQLQAWERDGITIAYFGKYHGQFQFLGRLTQPMKVIGRRDNDVADFLQENPDSRVITYYKILPTRADPVVTYPFRQGVMAVWDHATLVANPGIENRL